MTLIYRNLLIGGEPGAGKSSLLNTVIAHAALCSDCEAVAVRRQDGSNSACGARSPTSSSATTSPTPSTASAPCRPRWTPATRQLDAALRRKIDRIDGLPVILCAIDELAYFSVTIGTQGPAGRVQDPGPRPRRPRPGRRHHRRSPPPNDPSADIIPTSLRDLFGFRVAFRCTTDSSSDIILSVGWAQEGYSARAIRPRRTRRRLDPGRGRHPAADQGRLPDRPPDPRGRRTARAVAGSIRPLTRRAIQSASHFAHHPHPHQPFPE